MFDTTGLLMSARDENDETIPLDETVAEIYYCLRALHELYAAKPPYHQGLCDAFFMQHLGLGHAVRLILVSMWHARVRIEDFLCSVTADEQFIENAIRQSAQIQFEGKAISSELWENNPRFPMLLQEMVKKLANWEIGIFFEPE